MDDTAGVRARRIDTQTEITHNAQVDGPLRLESHINGPPGEDQSKHSTFPTILPSQDKETAAYRMLTYARDGTLVLADIEVRTAPRRRPLLHPLSKMSLLNRHLSRPPIRPGRRSPRRVGRASRRCASCPTYGQSPSPPPPRPLRLPPRPSRPFATFISTHLAASSSARAHWTLSSTRTRASLRTRAWPQRPPLPGASSP